MTPGLQVNPAGRLFGRQAAQRLAQRLAPMRELGHFEGLAQYFSPGHTKHALEGRVHADDTVVAICLDNGITAICQNRLGVFLGLAQLGGAFGDSVLQLVA